MEYLKNRIHDRQTLRDAQVQNGLDYQLFQNEITPLTEELRLWEQNIDQIDQLEATITATRGQAQAAARDLRYVAGSWWRLATVCGLIGALLLALNRRWSLNPLLLWLGAVLLVLAGGAVFMSRRARTSAWNIVTEANLQLAPIEEQRDALIRKCFPSYSPIKPFPPTRPFPRFSHEVIIRDR